MGSKNRLFIAFGGVVGLILGALTFVYYGAGEPAPTDASVVDKAVPEIFVYGSDEKNHSLKSLVAENSSAGKRSIVSLWATWCEPCRRELPQLKKALPELRARGIEVLLINYDDGPPARALPEVKAWLIANGIQELSTYFDFKQEIMNAMPVGGLPFAFGVGPEGKVLWTKLGELQWNADALFPR